MKCIFIRTTASDFLDKVSSAVLNIPKNAEVVYSQNLVDPSGYYSLFILYL